MKKNNWLFRIILTSILIALNVIMERFMSYSVWNLSIGFSFITIAFAAIFLGIPYAVIVGALGDIIGAILFPFGPYFVGFTITNVLTALTTAIFLYKNTSLFKITLSVLINKSLFTVFLNSLWIAILYKGGVSDLWAVAITRIPTSVVMFFIEVIIIYMLFSEKSKFRAVISKSLKQ